MSFSNVPANLLNVPLSSMSATVLDTETTGLDVNNDRVIELGAVKVASSQLLDSNPFELRIDPGVPLPPASTAIHGLTSDDLTGAPDFVLAMDGFHRWHGAGPIIGFCIDFDLAILQSEHERHGLRWNEPLAIDVRDLATIARPELGIRSLEGLASSLGVEVNGRHRALADAIMTARTFIRLLPALRSAGLLTLAEAVRAIQTGRRHSGNRPLRVRPMPAEVASVDSYPFRYRVGDIMTAPPISTMCQVALRDALNLMVEKKIGAVVVEGMPSHDYGILSEGDVMRALARDGEKALDRPVEAYSSCPLVSVHPREFVYRAIVLMSSHRFRHLGVREGSGPLRGIVSARDLFKRHTGDAIALGREIESAKNAADLGRVWSGLSTVARVLLRESVPARDITAMVSRELRALTRRACAIAERKLPGEPPESFCMMVLGSGGRGESMLAMDQDNAIVFESERDHEEAEAWCAALGERVADILDSAGVRFCDGGVMASSREWRRKVNEWRGTVQGWMENTRPENLMHADIFFDAMPVYGDLELGEKLRFDSLQMARANKPFLRLLAVRAASFPDAFSWLGRLQLEHKRIDLKFYGTMPLSAAARVVALEHGIRPRSTFGRLREFGKLGQVNERSLANLGEAHGILCKAILSQQFADLDDGLKATNSVEPAKMGGADLEQLKWALKQVTLIRDILGTPGGLQA